MSRPALSAAAVLVFVALVGAALLLVDLGQDQHGGGLTGQDSGQPESASDPTISPAKREPGTTTPIEVRKYEESFSDSPAGGLRVRVVDEEDKPVPNATVDVQRASRTAGGGPFMIMIEDRSRGVMQK